jgi:hypothetical protein
MPPTLLADNSHFCNNSLLKRSGNCIPKSREFWFNGLRSCTKDETDAKNELEKRWSQFGASEKGFCVGESSTGGERSYVELLTCLEMSTGQLSTKDQ